MRTSGLLWKMLATALAATAVACGEDEVVPFKTIPREAPPEARTPADVPAPPPLPSSASPQLFLTPSPTPATPPLFVAPAPLPNFAPGLPPGPVTNYGTGGMQAPPGAPPNPPYPPGGLMR
jgi:hypothetical protein